MEEQVDNYHGAIVHSRPRTQEWSPPATLDPEAEARRDSPFDEKLVRIAKYLQQPKIKRLVSNIVTQQEREKFKTLAVISELTKEGRSFITSLLAYAYATVHRKRVLILDLANLTSQHDWQFVDLLHQEGQGANPTTKTDNGVGELKSFTIHLLTAQSQSFDLEATLPPPPAASELQGLNLESLLSPILEALKPSYDLVLIDTSALSIENESQVDPLISAQKADRSVLVLTNLSMRRDVLEKIKHRINSSGISVLGTVHNQVS